jgi:two-component system cell cycle sensor histidine kinase/response regulator CckA
MIVDDQEVNRKTLACLLARRGDRLIEANDGTTALELARIERPDLAVVDLLMPEMDGFEFAHRLRSQGGPLARMPIVFISAMYLPDEVLGLARACGVYQLLSRDSTVTEILQAVDEAFRAPEADVTVPPWAEFALRLLQLHTNMVTNQMKTVIPALAELGRNGCLAYGSESGRCLNESCSPARRNGTSE